MCISLTPERLEQLQLPLMVPENQEKHKTAYTITTDYRHGTSTGISAHDRALTARMLADPALGAKSRPAPRPGHMNPLRYTQGGAGLPPAGLLCELVDPHDAAGSIAARDACLSFAREHGIKVTTIEMLRAWLDRA